QVFKSLSQLQRAAALPAFEGLPSGIAALDTLLGGGLPTGQIVELSGDRSSGKSTLALAACLRTLASERAAAWIGTPGFFPLATLEAGLPLERLLVVQVADGLSVLRAAQLLLSCPGAVGLLVLDLPASFAPAHVQLMRLQRLALRSATVLLLVTERAS